MILTRCPYCGKKISYFSLMYEKSHGEHFCDSCRKESKICIQKKAVLIFVLTTVLAVIIAGLLIMFNGVEKLWTVSLVIAPFVLFYLISPIFVDLRPYRKYKEWMTAHTEIISKEEIEKNVKKH